MNYLPTLMQWIHVASVVLLIGGFFFLRVILHPAARALSDANRSQLTESVFRRFRVVIWTTLITILVSGIYNFIAFLRAARAQSAIDPSLDYSLYILVLAIKFSIVFLIFTFCVLLTFPLPGFRAYPKAALTVVEHYVNFRNHRNFSINILTSYADCEPMISVHQLIFRTV